MNPLAGPAAADEALAIEMELIGSRLKAESPADTVAYAFGIGRRVLAWHDESGGHYFDLASLTKPLYTAPATLELITASADLDEPITDALDWLPRGRTGPTILSLLTHTAGLPAELPAQGDLEYTYSWFGRQLTEGMISSDRVVYSDAGYWLLGAFVAARADEPLHARFAQAPTTARGEVQFGQAPPGQTVPAGPVVGTQQLPHDPAARRLGPSGHAGAFGTLTGVVRAVMSWLDGTWLAAPAAAAAVTCQTHAAPGGHRSLAWTLAGDPSHVVAHDWPSTTLCHTGFTGVSAVLDPVSHWWAVYLSNALPIERDATPILIARRHFHAAVALHLSAAVESALAERPTFPDA